MTELARVLEPGRPLRFATDVARLRRLGPPAHPGPAGAFEWAAARADDWRVPPADHITTRYQEKRLGNCAPVFLDFPKALPAGGKATSRPALVGRLGPLDALADQLGGSPPDRPSA